MAQPRPIPPAGTLLLAGLVLPLVAGLKAAPSLASDLPTPTSASRPPPTSTAPVPASHTPAPTSTTPNDDPLPATATAIPTTTNGAGQPSPFTATASPAVSSTTATAEPTSPPSPATAKVSATVTPQVTPTVTLAPTQSPSATATAAASPQPTVTPTASLTASATPSPAYSATLTESPSPTATAAPGTSSTASPSPSTTMTAPTNSAPQRASPHRGAVLINEVAWAGTHASAYDEWIELHNPGADAISLAGWTLSDDGDLTVHLQGTLSPYGFYLLERTDEGAVASRAADQIYSGALSNSGETLELRDETGALVDSANSAGGGWPAGDSSGRASMERLGGDDIPGNWTTFSGFGGHLDADGGLIPGTPGGVNSPFLPTPTLQPTPTSTVVGSVTPSPTPTLPTTPTATNSATATPSASATASATMTASPSRQPTAASPGSILINEVAWAGTHASSFDEWIELHNPGPESIDLGGWRLTDGDDLSVQLQGTLPPYGYYLLERSDDTTVASRVADQIYTGSLRNEGEALELRDAAGVLIDSANQNGGGWPAGEASSRATMERLGGQDLPGNWVTFSGVGGHRDASGALIAGTPGGTNSPFLPTATPSPSPTATPTLATTPYADGRVLINEVAWSGTFASASDEWIELHNPQSEPVDLEGWQLRDGDDISAQLSGTIGAHGYYLLERSDDATISDIAAHMIYTGTLSNRGEVLELLGPGGEVVDSANRDGGAWPAGDSEGRSSMERRGGGDHSGNWGTFTGYGGRGQDGSGRSIRGTPGGLNSVLVPTPTPTWIPGQIVINEVLIRPHYDWEGTGGVTTADEFIELYNRGPGSVFLRGWLLDDVSGSGSRPFELPAVTISPGGYAVFFRGQTHIALNDGGDDVRLLAPDGRVVDHISYLRVRAYNLSYGRLPDGTNAFSYGLWPTPREANLLFVEPETETIAEPVDGFACEGGDSLWTRLPRLTRRPELRRLLHQLGLGVCLGS